MRFSTCLLGLLSIVCGAVDVLRGDVIVLASRTGKEISFTVREQDSEPKSHTLPVQELVSIPVTNPIEVRFGPGDNETEYSIDPNSVCFFSLSDTGLMELNRIGFAADAAKNADVQGPDDGNDKRKTAAGEPDRDVDPFADKICTIPVKIFVDDEEPFVRKRWEARLRSRIERASDILEQHCRVRFKVVAADTWDSDNAEFDFAKLLAEFEREVRVEPAALAIGFTSQPRIPQRRTRLGATFAPLRQFILIREWSKKMGEGERLEVLLHELGHYLGATHSPENDSIMRPNLNDGRANLPTFHLGFDPVNTLIMCLVGDEIRKHGVRHLHQLTPRSRAQLKSIYREIVKITPDEPATVRLLDLLDAGPPAGTSAAESRAKSE